VNFIDAFFDNLANHAGRPLIGEVHTTTLKQATGKELQEMVAKARGTLRVLGLKKGDRVAFVAPNSIRWLACDLALLAEGMISVPLYSRQAANELGYMIGDCEAGLVIAATDKVAMDIAPHVGDRPLITFDALFGGIPCTEPRVEVGPEDYVTMVYTSGTSGPPKGAVYARDNIDFMLPVVRSALEELVDGVEGEQIFHYLPLCFAGSRIVLWVNLLRGVAVNLSTNLDELADEIHTAAPHHFLNVPALLERVKRGAEAKLRSLPAPLAWLYERALVAHERVQAGQAGRRDRLALAAADRIMFSGIRAKLGGNVKTLICGSAPLAPATQAWWAMLGIPVHQVYGLTETTAIVTMDPRGAVVPGLVGTAIPGVEMKLGEGDELLIRGRNIFKAYWNKQAKYGDAVRDGWFHTGDQCEIVDGRLKVVGRVKNILVPSTGHNVAPEPIEQELMQTVEGAAQVVVVGHGRPFLTAIITGEDVDQAQAKAAVDAVNQGLPHYKRVRDVHFRRDPLTDAEGLLTANQKLRRRAIDEAFVTEIDRMYSA